MYTISKSKLFISFFLASLVLIISTSTAKTEVFEVSNAGKLRKALEVSQSNGEIDNIILAAGNYNTGGNPFTYSAVPSENFGLNMSGAGIDSTKLSGSDKSAVLVIDTTAVVNDSGVYVSIDDLSIKEGSSAKNSDLAGGLTLLSNNGNIGIDDCSFDSNTGDSGGAYVETKGQISLTKSQFTNNKSLTKDGGGASLTGKFVLITDCEFDSNSTVSSNSRGGGLSANAVETTLGESPAYGTIILNGNSFQNNKSEGHAGASLSAKFGVELQGNSFINNTAGKSGAAGVYVETKNTDPGEAPDYPNKILTRFYSNLFNGNMSEGGPSGGAQIVSGQDVIGVNNIFVGNKASSSAGAYLRSQGVTFSNNTITLNSASGSEDSNGGGISFIIAKESTADIYNNIVFNNSASGNGGDIYINDDLESNNKGAVVNLVANDFKNIYSICKQTPSCVSNIKEKDNIDKDPLFVNANSRNLNLSKGSPAIQTGSPDAPELPSSDFAGNPVDDDKPDMGALQFVNGNSEN